MSDAPKGTAPAFPNPEASFDHFGSCDGYMGLTLRDAFAIAALPAAMSRWPDGAPNGFDGIAKDAYMAADAMLKARAA
jgi:hypothetical protein